MQKKERKRKAAAVETNTEPPLLNPVIWHLRFRRKVPAADLIESLAPHVDAGPCAHAFGRWADENAEAAGDFATDEARRRRGLEALVDSALKWLTSEKACEVTGEGGGRAARLRARCYSDV